MRQIIDGTYRQLNKLPTWKKLPYDDWPETGTGRRSRPTTWSRGISGKQNRARWPSFCGRSSKPFVAVYGDSQLRPVVEGCVSPGPKGRLAFGYNCTPGGSLRHIRQEMKDNPPPREPAMVVLVAGTNNLSAVTTSLEVDMEEFHHVLLSAKEQFPMSKLAAVGILPRLDRETSMYNSYFKTICDREGVNFLDYTEDFPTNQRKLWSRHDSLHLSEDAGIPRLLQLLEDSCVQLLEAGKQLTPEQWAALEWDKGGRAYVPQLSTRHAGLYKAQIWTKEEGGTANPATGNCKRHKKRVSKKCKAKRKLYQPSWDAFNFKDWREPQTPANPPSQSPVCDPPSQSPVCDPPSQSPVCDPPSQSPVCDPPSQSPVCDPPSQSPVCDPPSQSPVCDPPSQSPVCDPPSQSPVCDPPSQSPVCDPPSQSPVCDPPSQSPVCDPPSQSPVCDPPSQSPVCDPPSQSPVCDPPSQSPVCDPPSQSPVCDPPSQSPVCDPPSQSPVCDPLSQSPVCDPPSQSPVCDPPSLSPSSNILNPPSHSPACNNIPPQTPLSDNPTVGSYMHSMVSRRMCIPVYCHVVVQHTYVCVHCKNERKIE
ncbi:uncharacterized protein LOC144913258 [Branchiostoma floridae x Branchiostoma belcheri]